MDSGLTLHPSAAPRLMTRHCRADKTNSFVRVLDLVRRQQLKFDRAQAYRSHNSQAGLLPQNRVCRRSFLHSVAILLASSRVQLPAQAILVEENVTDRVFQVAGISFCMLGRTIYSTFNSALCFPNSHTLQAGLFQKADLSGCHLHVRCLVV